MKDECLLVLDAFLKIVSDLEDYTLFSCHRITGILDAEERLSNKWTEFELLNTTDWNDIRSLIDEHASGKLLAYGMRMAFLAVRHRKQVGVWHGLMGLVVDNDILDYRDVLTVATLLYDAATRLEASPEVMFQRAIVRAAPRRAKLLKGYLVAPDFTKSVQSMGFEAADTESGFVYKMLC